MTLFPPDDKSRLPVTIYAGLAPSNPHATVSWFRSLDLANRGMLASALISEQLMQFDPDDRWFRALEVLEERGIRRGVTPDEVATALDCASVTARRHMLIGEFHLFALFGINVCFSSGNGVWRIATREEAAAKYSRGAAEIKEKNKRNLLYSGQHGAVNADRKSVQIELFIMPKAKKGKGKAKGKKHEAAD